MPNGIQLSVAFNIPINYSNIIQYKYKHTKFFIPVSFQSHHVNPVVFWSHQVRFSWLPQLVDYWHLMKIGLLMVLLIMVVCLVVIYDNMEFSKVSDKASCIGGVDHVPSSFLVWRWPDSHHATLLWKPYIMDIICCVNTQD